MARQKLNPRTLVARKRQKDAYDLRIIGMTLDAIAQQLGYATPSGAWKAIRAYLKRLGPPPEAEDYRQVQVGRLEKVLARCFDQLDNREFDPRVVGRILNTIAQISDLMALHIPKDDRMTVEVRGLPDLGKHLGIEEIARYADTLDIIERSSPEDAQFLRDLGWNNGPPGLPGPDSHS